MLALIYREEAGHRSGEEAPAGVLGFLYGHDNQRIKTPPPAAPPPGQREACPVWNART
jgi:hypothetical protein